MEKVKMNTSDVIRAGIGGIMMGLANLVPGISGGTMLLAAGVYRYFVDGIAELSSFKIRLQTIFSLAAIGLPAALSILLFAGLFRDLVMEHRWIMYSIFIGLTLGGIPVIWSKLSGFKPGLLLPIAAGLLVMVATVFIKPSGDTSTSSMGILALAGVLGASAMVLPGISGGYILLVMGQYVTILGGIDLFKTGLKSQDMQLIVEGMKICVPVGIGVVSGIVIVSHLIRFFFKRYEDGTYGLLLGLLVGAVFGLWPFQNPVPPQLGDTIRGLLLDTPEKVAAVDPKYFAVAFFTPSLGQIVTSILLIVAGFLLTVGIDRLGQYLEKNGSKA